MKEERESERENVVELRRMCVYLGDGERLLLERMAASEDRSMSWMLRQVIREGASCRDIQ